MAIITQLRKRNKQKFYFDRASTVVLRMARASGRWYNTLRELHLIPPCRGKVLLYLDEEVLIL
jgi:hypothetical protein